MESPGRALFLDRDGVVNREIGYLCSIDQVEFTPGIFTLCRAAQDNGYKIIIVTNQAGIAREMYSENDFHLLMRWMDSQFKSYGIDLSDYYYCPHHPEHGTGKYRRDCPDRKPNPGMLLRAARDHNLDLNQSILIGDRCTDMQAGASAGISKLIFLSNHQPDPCALPTGCISIVMLDEALSILSS